MNKSTLIIVILAAFVLGYVTRLLVSQNSESGKTAETKEKKEIKKEENEKDSPKTELKNETSTLGAFSVSLNVKDLKASRKFYETLGFTTDMDESSNYLIMKNGNTLIGIFKGFIKENALTFNPGWDQNAQPFDPFDDVRDIQKKLKAAGYKLDYEANESTTGPDYLLTKDPDGNVIMIDQHR